MKEVEPGGGGTNGVGKPGRALARASEARWTSASLLPTQTCRSQTWLSSQVVWLGRRFSAEVEGRKPWWLKVEGQRLSVHLARLWLAARTFDRELADEKFALWHETRTWHWCSAS